MAYCLDYYIGLMGCGLPEPESGLYLNDLAGMSNQLLQNIASPDQASYLEVYNSIQRVAFQRLKSDLYTALFQAGNVKLNGVLHKSRPLQVLNRRFVIPRLASEQYRGAYVQVSGSKYLSVYCESILVFSGNVSEYPITTTLRVFQTQDASEIYSQEIQVSPGVNKITVNQEFNLEFDALNLYFAVDCSEITTLQNPFLWYGWAFAGCDYCDALAYPFWQINGWQMYPAITDLDWDGSIPRISGKQSGVWPLLEIRCSIDAFICRYKEQLKMSIAYLLAIQTLEVKQNTKQQNFFAQSSKEQTEKTRTEYLESYAADLNAFCKSVDFSGEGFCFDTRHSRKVASLPMVV